MAGEMQRIADLEREVMMLHQVLTSLALRNQQSRTRLQCAVGNLDESIVRQDTAMATLVGSPEPVKVYECGILDDEDEIPKDTRIIVVKALLDFEFEDGLMVGPAPSGPLPILLNADCMSGSPE